MRILYLILYYGFAQYLPDSYSKPLGQVSNWIRCFLVKKIAKKVGLIDTINRRVYFGNGEKLELGDHCTLGANVSIPNDTIVGAYSMVSRQVYILHGNHNFSNPDIPIKLQGSQPDKQTIIEDDVWIGMRSFLTPGRRVRKGSIVAAGSVLTKDFPEYSVIGGNPAKLIKSRK
ncbi:MAG: acyltransferase [Bacteroidaceae bacterium]|nr:acyltransferase [Bacteroidaceae bacterium]